MILKLKTFFFLRRLSLLSTEGETRVVTQMQMIVWPDLGAPNEARLV